jgi:hypothetical protein
MSSMLETKRATRGLRMADLVGQAADDDEQFWNNDVWNEDGSDADSFKSEDEELKPDEFDSDFNDSETEEEESDSDEENVKKAARAQTVRLPQEIYGLDGSLHTLLQQFIILL